MPERLGATLKVAYVMVRYGEQVLGGAELGARMLAERLVAMCGVEVDVYTTCALDARTWADELPAGDEVVHGVRVHRFTSETGRDSGFEAFSRTVLPAPARASRVDQERWIDLQGPVMPAALDAAAAGDADVVVFYPYLYWPTVRGVLRCSDRAVVHPAAHDEPPLRLPLFADVLGAAKGLVFQTESERRLVESLYKVGATPQLLMGLGVEQHDGDTGAFRVLAGLDDRPYLLYLGRVDEGKGTRLLFDAFVRHKTEHPGPLALAFAGPVVDRPPAHADVVVVGAVDERVKWGALRGAHAFVNPSPNEAFSIVLMEAWTAGLAVLVNEQCGATTEHVHRSGGGMAFGDAASFSAAVRALDDPRLRAEHGQRGAAYVEANFTWPTLMRRYSKFLEQVVARRG